MNYVTNIIFNLNYSFYTKSVESLWINSVVMFIGYKNIMPSV